MVPLPEAYLGFLFAKAKVSGGGGGAAPRRTAVSPSASRHCRRCWNTAQILSRASAHQEHGARARRRARYERLLDVGGLRRPPMKRSRSRAAGRRPVRRRRACRSRSRAGRSRGAARRRRRRGGGARRRSPRSRSRRRRTRRRIAEIGPSSWCGSGAPPADVPRAAAPLARRPGSHRGRRRRTNAPRRARRRRRRAPAPPRLPAARSRAARAGPRRHLLGAGRGGGAAGAASRAAASGSPGPAIHGGRSCAGGRGPEALRGVGGSSR